MSELRVLVSLREGQHPIVKVRTFRWQVSTGQQQASSRYHHVATPP